MKRLSVRDILKSVKGDWADDSRADPPADQPSAVDTFDFRGFEIPIRLALLTGGGPDTFEVISDAHMRAIDREHPLAPGLSIFELGCGIGRDAIPLAERIGPVGSYVGVDIIGESIQWCSTHITARYPNCRFHHDDVSDTLHNPDGQVSWETVRLPAETATVDLVIAQSVFTHMLRAELSHYLSEFRRILAPGGTIYATCFRVSEQILEVARRTNLTPFDLRFEHDLGGGCFVNELLHLTGAVAYTEAVLEEMVSEAGLRLRGPVRPGGWSGYFSEPYDGQDVLVLEH